MKINWSNEASTDIEDIDRFIALENPVAAANLFELLTETVEKIAQMPYIGRTGRVAGTREFVAHPNYIIVYKVMLDEILILRILHGRRKYP